jgi:putative addiction module killer protein
MKYTVYETDEYTEWLDTQPLKSRRQIQDRILKIEEDGYFGHHKYLEQDDLWELKFNDGRRIYYIIVPETKVILLLGGNKNGQNKDIKKASNILSKLGEEGS